MSSINHFAQQSPTSPTCPPPNWYSVQKPHHQHGDKPWPCTHPYNIVESPGVQDSTGEVKSVEGFSQGAVTMALRKKTVWVMFWQTRIQTAPGRRDPEQLDLARSWVQTMGLAHKQRRQAHLPWSCTYWRQEWAWFNIGCGIFPKLTQALFVTLDSSVPFLQNLQGRIILTFLGLNI